MEPFSVPGTYNHRIQFLRPAYGYPATGELYPVYSPAFTVWGQASPAAALDLSDADGKEAVEMRTVRIRKTPFLLRKENRVRPGWRALLGGITCRVQSVADATTTSEEWEIDLQEVLF